MTGAQYIADPVERARTPVERRYRGAIQHPRQIVACFDLDGILADERGLSPDARAVLARFDRRRWTPVVTTASPAEHAYSVLRPVENLLAGVFTEIFSRHW